MDSVCTVIVYVCTSINSVHLYNDSVTLFSDSVHLYSNSYICIVIVYICTAIVYVSHCIMHEMHHESHASCIKHHMHHASCITYIMHCMHLASHASRIICIMHRMHHASQVQKLHCTSIPPLSLIDDVIAISECSTNSIEVCATVKTKFEGKQLEFGAKKCHQIHVGKLAKSCRTLNINTCEMNKSTSERYLGDILSSDGKNDLNVTDRYNKGIGYVNQILGILKEISFGHYYFEQAIQLRNAKLVNGMLCSIEAMYGLTIAQIEKLEKCDRQFFRKIFNAPVSTPTESFYIETNTLPLRFIIIGRRLLYYWTILNKSDNELVKQVFKTQQLSPVKNDWCEAVKLDMKFLDIDIMENDIIGMKKSKFKSLIKRKLGRQEQSFLLTLKIAIQRPATCS